MTNAEARKIVEQIEGLVKSEKQQVGTEFEGHAPGFEMPQHSKRVELIRQINASGTHAYTLNDGLVAWEDFRKGLEGCKTRVAEYKAAHPGEGIPFEKVQEWSQQECGLTYGAIQHFKQTFGLE